MTDLIEVVAQTMSSREIAELTGKRHDHVLRDCDNLNENYLKMGLPKIGEGYYTHPNTGSQQHREYRLTKIQTFDLMTGYNVELRIKVNRRWEQLETERQFGKFKVPTTFREALLLAAQQQEELEAAQTKVQILESENEAQQEELKAIAPLADYTREVLQSTSTFTATQIAKDLGMSAVTLNAKLRRLGVQFYQSGQWFLTAKYQGRGYTDMRIAKYVDSRTDEVKTSQSLVWTERGRLFINTLNKEGKL